VVVAHDFNRSRVVRPVAAAAFAVVVGDIGIEAGAAVVGIAFARFGFRRFFPFFGFLLLPGFFFPCFLAGECARFAPGLAPPRFPPFPRFGLAKLCSFLPGFPRRFLLGFLLDGTRFRTPSAASKQGREADRSNRCYS